VSASYLLVIGEREALAWILRESRMAFPATTRREVDRLRVGDTLFLLTTRGCFHNPGRDRTRVIGRATVTSEVAPLDPVPHIAGRDFPRGCDLEIYSLTPYLEGVELAPLVPRLGAFAGSTAWGMRLSRPLVLLSGGDDEVQIDRALRCVERSPDDVTPDYLARIRPVGTLDSRGESL
jgi:hypothetical protein